ncbi:MAG TPA: efflux RND transporter periplasmic adaptor subunit [Steroidobacteraceae bacterium]|jgi:multidrug efflux system membrane fusion protein|nr:efflux RND transporter periplasmic adaptor subunit [Steroidobacteraceae bacterium]
MIDDGSNPGADVSPPRAQARHGGVLQRRARWLWGAAVAALVLGALIWYTHQPVAAAAAPKEPAAVAVHTAVAMRSDVPVYLQGLGTVQAFYTATMTARVDGELDSVDFIEGQHVNKGQVLAQIDPRPYRAALDQAMATQAKDAAQLESAKGDLARYMVLAPQNLTSKQTVADQRALVAQLTAQVQIDGAAIDNARTQLAYTTIVAPFAGRTGLRLIDPGNNVHATDTTGIVVLTQMQPISTVFTLPEDELLQINQALARGAVSVTALSQDGRTQLDVGTLTVVDNQIDPTTGTMRLKATFPNPHNTLWPGEFVNVRVLAAQQRGVVTIPSAAVQEGPDGPFTYVVQADSSVQVRPLKLGEQSGELTVIASGLTAGERVVTSNQFRLQPGARVQSS